MSLAKRSKTAASLVALAVLAALAMLGLACSTDSPTAPEQRGAPVPQPDPSLTWRIRITASPAELTAGTLTASTITVRVERLSNGNAPPSGTTLVASTSLGDFVSPGSGIDSVVLTLIQGGAQVQLFPGAVVGTAVITAQLENSIRQATVPIREAIADVVAAWSFTNTDESLSVTFLNQSTGDPTSFFWDFGDGGTSTEQHPVHVFSDFGDWVVSMTASKQGSSDTLAQVVTIEAPEPEEPPAVPVAAFTFVVNDCDAIFTDASSGEITSFSWDFGDGFASTQKNPVHTYATGAVYTVTHTVSGPGGSDTSSRFVTVPQAGGTCP